MTFRSILHPSSAKAGGLSLLWWWCATVLTFQVSDGQNFFNTMQQRPQSPYYFPPDNNNYWPSPQQSLYPYYTAQQQPQYNPFAQISNNNPLMLRPPPQQQLQQPIFTSNLQPKLPQTITPATTTTTVRPTSPSRRTTTPAPHPADDMSCRCENKKPLDAPAAKNRTSPDEIVASAESAVFSGTPLSHQSIFAPINPIIQLGVVDFTIPQLRGWGTTKAGRFAATNVIGHGVFFRIIVAKCSFCESSPDFMLQTRYPNGTCACTCCIPLYPETNIPCKFCANLQRRTVVGFEPSLGDMCACYAWDIGWKPPRLDEQWNEKCGPWPPNTGRRAAKKAMEDAGLKFIEPQLPPGDEPGVPAVSQENSVADAVAGEDGLPGPGEISMPTSNDNRNSTPRQPKRSANSGGDRQATRQQNDVEPASSRPQASFAFNNHFFSKKG